ncbi:hypothetical protein F5Y03DRAFT_396112 [Xylaria venustula]|nr:hypothetical protein F5Y03DRAFT_396112 [Xylaria venustula]
MAPSLALNSPFWHFCENYIYRLPEPPPRIRQKPMQVLCVGLSRSGTESLAKALDILGYSTYHGWDLLLEEPTRSQGWKRLVEKKYYGTPDGEITVAEFDSLLGHATAVIEKVAYFFAPELIAAYPEAKVILNQRSDLDKWSRSMERTVVPVTGSYIFFLASFFDARTFWSYHFNFRWFLALFYRNPGDEVGLGILKRGKWVYRDHCNMVRGQVDPERLLEWSVEDGWEPLCEFLGKAIPDEPFPNVNAAGTQFNTKAAEVTDMGLKSAARNFLVTLIVFGAVATYAWSKLRRGP